MNELRKLEEIIQKLSFYDKLYMLKRVSAMVADEGMTVHTKLRNTCVVAECVAIGQDNMTSKAKSELLRVARYREDHGE